MARQSIGAQLDRQPTPGSVKRAEERAQTSFTATLARAKRFEQLLENPGHFNARGFGSGIRMAPRALPARWLTDEVTRLPTATSAAWVEAGGGGRQPAQLGRPTRMASARQLRTLNRLRARALGELAIGIDASLSGEIDGPVCSVSIAGPRGS
jgi:hypothetical protein